MLIQGFGYLAEQFDYASAHKDKISGVLLLLLILEMKMGESLLLRCWRLRRRLLFLTLMAAFRQPSEGNRVLARRATDKAHIGVRIQRSLKPRLVAIVREDADDSVIGVSDHVL